MHTTLSTTSPRLRLGLGLGARPWPRSSRATGRRFALTAQGRAPAPNPTFNKTTRAGWERGRRAMTVLPQALFGKKADGAGRGKAKKTTAAPMSGKNFINPKPLYAPGDEPWYIDPETGKAPGYLQLAAFVASQLFVGQVMVPVSIWWEKIFDPILNK